jgi:hypothetical protein
MNPVTLGTKRELLVICSDPNHNRSCGTLDEPLHLSELRCHSFYCAVILECLSPRKGLADLTATQLVVINYPRTNMKY